MLQIPVTNMHMGVRLFGKKNMKCNVLLVQTIGACSEDDMHDISVPVRAHATAN